MGFYFSLFGLDWVMLRRVVDLFACWRGQFDSLHNVTLWKMILSFLMWCIWSGEKEITVVLKTMRGNGELKTFFVFIPCTTGRLHMIIFIFLVLVIFLALFLHLVYLGCAHALLIKFDYLSKNMLDAFLKFATQYFAVSMLGDGKVISRRSGGFRTNSYTTRENGSN
jgi:hypothetical protein